MEEKEKRNSTPVFKAVKATEVLSENIPENSQQEQPTAAAQPEEITEAVAVQSEETSSAAVHQQPVPEETDEEEEEIVFAGVPATAEQAQTAKAEPSRSKKLRYSGAAYEAADAPAEEEVVFAAADSKPRHKAIPKARRGKKSPAVPIVITGVVLVGVAGVTAAVIAGMNRSAPVSEEKKETQVTSAVSEEIKTEPIEELDIKNVDTTNILFGKNVTVEGVDLSGKTLTQAHKVMQERLQELREPISITVVCDGSSFTLTQNDFEYDTNLSGVLLQAYHYSRGELDKPSTENTYNDGVTDFKVAMSLNTESVDAAVETTAKHFDKQPVDAHVTKFDPTAAQKFEYVDGSDGFLLDHNELDGKIKEILNRGEKTGSFTIETHQTPFKISLADIKANTRLIGSHSTSCFNSAASVHNMQLALRAANGTVVNPGETFSFNDMTGDTTNGNEHYYANGTTGSYEKSKAYSQGRVVDDYGGGICQASTTIYLAAVKANMQVVDRYPHMYTSDYAPTGLDATVDYGNLDMRFKNPTDYPVYIATYVYDYNGDGVDELMVEIYGPISDEYDEIVPVGWMTYAESKQFYAASAKVYFKNGKETGRVRLPAGPYKYNYETYYSVQSQIPADKENGPAVSPTYTIPTIYSPNGCGENGPVPYGTAGDILKAARSGGTAAPSGGQTADSSNPSGGTYVTVT